MEKYGANLIAEKEIVLQELKNKRQEVFNADGGLEKVSQLTNIDREIKEIEAELTAHKS